MTEDILLETSYGSDGADPSQYLLKQLRPDDMLVLDLACGSGEFGSRMKALAPGRIVIGFEKDATIAEQARNVLDLVFDQDIEEGDLPPIPPESVDCIVLGDSLHTLRDPAQVLRRLKPLLKPTGQVICSVQNVQHISALASILAGDVQYQPDGPLNRNHRRLFGAANIQKMFLDAGYLPNFADAIRGQLSDAMKAAFRPLLTHLKLNAGFFESKAAIHQYICVASPMADVEPRSEGITFIIAVNNTRQLRDNLCASPVLQNERHEVIPVVGATSAADALQTGLGRSHRRNGLFVLLHQDVYLPAGWDDKLIAGIVEAERTVGPVGVAGVFGVVRSQSGSFERAGKTLDRTNLLATPHQLPASCDSLDEIVLAFPVQNGSIVGLAETLGFHMYGSEACLAAWDFEPGCRDCRRAVPPQFRVRLPAGQFLRGSGRQIRRSPQRQPALRDHLRAVQTGRAGRRLVSGLRKECERIELIPRSGYAVSSYLNNA